MKNKKNPNVILDDFGEEKLILPKLEKDYSYFDSCKTLMHEIERTYRFAFFYSVFMVFLVCITAPFQQRFQLFSFLSFRYGELSGAEESISIFVGGVCQITVAILVLILGYIAWTHVRRLNILLFCFYAAMCLLGLWRHDWRSVILGLIGTILYIRAMLYLVQEERLSKLEGYPYFNERFQLSKDDFEKPPLRSDQPHHACYMDSLTKRTLRGEAELKIPIQKKEAPPLDVDPDKIAPLEDILSEKQVYTKHEALPSVEEISLSDSDAEPSAAPLERTPTPPKSQSAQRNKNHKHRRK